MERVRSHPDIAGKVLRLEYTAMSLNPKAKLYGRKSLLETCDPTQPRNRACLEAFERELDMPWALSHVRRVFLLSEDGRRRTVKRSGKQPLRPQQGDDPDCRHHPHGRMRGSREDPNRHSQDPARSLLAGIVLLQL
ncbi:hypothetical protein [Streptomyces bobili]|uniref:hypothetical protein n=1 Tax=Streptomyces bobili TaxID=67280 RepID=UPI003F53F0DD